MHAQIVSLSHSCLCSDFLTLFSFKEEKTRECRTLLAENVLRQAHLTTTRQQVFSLSMATIEVQNAANVTGMAHTALTRLWSAKQKQACCYILLPKIC